MEKEVRLRVTKQYHTNLWFRLACFIVGIIIIPGLLIMMYNLSRAQWFDELWEKILLSVGTELVASIITCILIKPLKLIGDYNNRNNVIEERVKIELQNYYNNTVCE